jgi:hypothetical protein
VSDAPSIADGEPPKRAPEPPVPGNTRRSSFHHALTPLTNPHDLLVLPTRIYRDAEWSAIQAGYRSREMEERWDILVEDRTLFVFRASSGAGTFEATFEPTVGGWVIAAARSIPFEIGGGASDEYAALLLEVLISWLLLWEQPLALVDQLLELVERLEGAAMDEQERGITIFVMVGARDDSSVIKP